MELKFNENDYQKLLIKENISKLENELQEYSEVKNYLKELHIGLRNTEKEVRNLSNSENYKDDINFKNKDYKRLILRGEVEKTKDKLNKLNLKKEELKQAKKELKLLSK